MSTRRRRPRELTAGLEPIRVGLLRADHQQAYEQAVAGRNAELLRRLETLREWYGIARGPNCWRDLCLAMAAERFTGFRIKAGRKPPKWTPGVLTVLAGEMRRALDAGADTQEKAAQRIASSEPWRSFLGHGRWKGRARPQDRAPWENLLNEYTRMPQRYRAMGEAAYVGSVREDRLAEWDDMVRSYLAHPSHEEK